MAIDNERATRFNREMLELTNNLNFGEGYESFKARLLDLVAKRQIDGETLQAFKRQISHIFDKDFTPFIDRSFNAYDDVVGLVNDEYSDIADIDINRDLDKIQALEKVNNTRLGQYKNNAVREIAKTVRKSIIDGQTHTQLALDLSRSTDDKVVSFANTIARTQVQGYGQATKTEKARLGQVFFYQYVGIERDSTRIFCIELLRQGKVVFHINDINQMRNSHKLGVLYYRGGFNCHHRWEPDPFATNDGYSVSFYTKKEGKRDLKLAKSSQSQTKREQSQKFKPVKTKAEASRFLKQKYKIDSSFRGMELDLTNSVVDQFDKLSDEFPEVADRLEFFGVRSGSRRSRAIAAASVDGKFIRLSPSQWKNRKSLERNSRISVEQGFYPKGTEDLRSIISHEFGHQVENWIETLPPEVRILKDEWSKTRWHNLKKSDVSAYATTNRQEMFAESFAELKHNKAPREYARSIGAMLKEVKEKLGDQQ